VSKYYTNFDDLKKEDLQTLLKNYSSTYFGNEYKKIHEQILNDYLDIFCNKNYKKEEYYFGIANFDIVVILSNYIYESYINNKKFVKTSGNQIFFKFNNLHSEAKLKINFPKISIIRKIKYLLKKNYNLIKYHLFYSKKLKKIYLVGSNQIETKYYFNSFNYFPIKIDLFDIYNVIINKNFERYLNKKIRLLLEKNFKRFRFLSNKDQKLINKNITDLIIVSGVKYQTFRRYFKKYKSQDLFVGTISGWLPIKNIIAAISSLDLKITCFNHGYSACYNMKPDFYNEGSLAANNIFISSKSYKQTYDNFFKGYKNQIILPKFHFFEKSPYLDIFNKIKKINEKKLIKKILIMGYPKSPLFNLNETHNHLFSTIQLEIKIINLLKNNSFDVYYKCHPDRISEMQNLFDKSVKVINKKFENIYLDYDCAIFTYYRSTAFGYGLMTGIPIVYFINSNYKMDNKTFITLNKRCSVVKTVSSNEDELKFNNKDLLEAIKSSKNKQFDLEWLSYLN
tara:strand:- start:24458 stop:25984 length:1527 start_codon:yes stop_codon:yes gene_type:complete